MNKKIILFLTALLAFAACQKLEPNAVAGESIVLSAQIEQGDLTKTALGSDKKVIWSENDHIMAFMKSSAGNQYSILPEFAGKTYADFSGNSLAMGSDWEHIVAYYPYSSTVKCSKSGSDYIIDAVIPAEQAYTQSSFANGSFPMVAVSTESKLAFKNVCGGIKLQLKGSANVASIKIEGRNNEKLSGAAKITAKGNGELPSIAMDASASATATLKCSPSVKLNSNTATEFIISLPPVEFTKGFTITVTDTENNTYTVETSKKNTVMRSSLLAMPPKTIVKDATIEDNLAGWTNVTANYGTLPDYIKIYKSPSTLQGRNAVAYIAVADLKKGGSWDVWSVQTQPNSDSYVTYNTSDSFVTPSTLYGSEYWQQPPVIINGGYFYYEGGNYTASLAKREWSTDPLSYNINYEYNSAGKICYPTRAAFLEYADGSIDACWTYVSYVWLHWIYPTPAPANNTNQPNESYPAGAKYFAAKTGIGGGPVLIDNGVIKNTWSEEMLSGITPESLAPRSAIGVTANKEIVLFACEGRYITSGIPGFTTGEVANILYNLGCVEAINLDGGGSTCMLVNGIQTVKPSDGSQRAVASCVMLK